jgi:hypothetical protein
VANWNDDMYDTTASTDAGSALYFYAIIVVGNWMLLNLFIAILIQGFAEQKATQLAENLQRMQEQFLATLGGLSQQQLATQMQTLFAKMDKDNSGVIDKRELQKMLEDLEVRLTEKELTQLFRKYDQDGSGEIDFSEFLSLIKDLLQKAEAAVHGGQNDASIDVDQIANMTNDAEVFQEAQKLHEEQQRNKVDHVPVEAVPKSLFILSENNPIRVACKKLVEWKWFDRYILVCILISCVSLGYENPGISEVSPTGMALKDIDLFLNLSFITECVADSDRRLRGTERRSVGAQDFPYLPHPPRPTPSSHYRTRKGAQDFGQHHPECHQTRPQHARYRHRHLRALRHLGHAAPLGQDVDVLGSPPIPQGRLQGARR